MKPLLLQIFVLLSLIAAANLNLSAQLSDWDGTFSGNLVGIETILTAKSDNTYWKGTIDAGGYAFTLEGQINANECSGTMADIQTGTAVPFILSVIRNGLILSIRDINPLSGIEEDMKFTFTRTHDAAPVPSPTTQQTDPSLLDMNLVGNWRRTESYVSGEFSFATDWHLQINRDGTYAYGEGRTAGGGPNSSIDSGTGRTEHGQWKSENNAIWLFDGTRWQRYAKYYQEGNNLMFTFDNGSKHIWERI